MTDIKIFRLHENSVETLKANTFSLERSLQKLMENNLEALLGVRFLVSEHSTGAVHRGRIDTLGLDENNLPVIIEYKRALNENVITQGLFYLSWLVDHKAEFKLLVINKLGQAVADVINWSSPRLICISGSFTRYDQSATEQMGRAIDLIRYARFGEDLLVLEQVTHVGIEDQGTVSIVSSQSSTTTTGPNGANVIEQPSENIQDLYYALDAFLIALGDDVQKRILSTYTAYKRIKNFVCVQFLREEIVLYLKADMDHFVQEPNFTRDMRNRGHYGTGDLEVRISTLSDLEKAKPLILQSYDLS
jgi:predicted transport protein